jgi:MYND finger
VLLGQSESVKHGSVPGQYYTYIPFLDPGDLQAAVDKWFDQLKMTVYKHNLLNNLLAKLQLPKNDDTAEVARKVVEMQNDLKLAPVPTKQPIRLKHDGNSKPLQILSGKDPTSYTLYVVGHCAPGSDSLLNKRGRIMASETIKADRLAERMGKDGLPKEIFYIKLLSCYGALADSGHGYKAYAENLFTELQSYCINFRLTGYKEPVMISEFYKDDSAPMKTFGKITLGTVIPSTIPIGGRLSSQSEQYNFKAKNVCAVCGKPAKNICSRCRTTHYCSVDCQKAQWPNHKLICKQA